MKSYKLTDEEIEKVKKTYKNRLLTDLAYVAQKKLLEWLNESCVDCNGEIMVLRKECPECQQLLLMDFEIE